MEDPCHYPFDILLPKIRKGEVLYELDLSGHSVFIGARLDMANAHFVDCDFKSANFEELNLSLSTFQNCNFSSANFWYCDLSTTRFINCDLTSASFEGCSMEKSDFASSTLKRATFSLACTFVENYPQTLSNTADADARQPPELHESSHKIVIPEIDFDEYFGTGWAGGMNFVGHPEPNYEDIQRAMEGNRVMNDMSSDELWHSYRRGKLITTGNFFEVYPNDLREINLSAVDLEGSLFWLSDMRGANLTKSNLKNTVFLSVNIDSEDVSKANFSLCEFLPDYEHLHNLLESKNHEYLRDAYIEINNILGKWEDLFDLSGYGYGWADVQRSMILGVKWGNHLDG